jgi:hypothetical protein
MASVEERELLGRKGVNMKTKNKNMDIGMGTAVVIGILSMLSIAMILAVAYLINYATHDCSPTWTNQMICQYKNTITNAHSYQLKIENDNGCVVSSSGVACSQGYNSTCNSSISTIECGNSGFSEGNYTYSVIWDNGSSYTLEQGEYCYGDWIRCFLKN